MPLLNAMKSALVMLAVICGGSSGADTPLLRLSSRQEQIGVAVIPITIQGTTYDCVLDTGSTHHVFDVSLVRALGPRVQSLPTKIDGAQIQLYRPPEMMAVADLTVKATDNLVVVTDLTLLREATGVDVSGIIGCPLVQDYLIRMNPDLNTVEFFAPGSLTLDPRDEVALQTDKFGRPFVHVSVPGVFSPIKMLVDTGSSSELVISEKMFDEYVERDIIRVFATRGSAGIGTARSIPVGRIESMHLGDVASKRVLASRGDADTLGMRYLSRFIVTIDVPSRVMHLKPSSRFDRIFDADMSGVRLFARDGRVIVKEVVDGSPADHAGIVPDDVIQVMDGRPVNTQSLGSLRDYLMREDGKVITLRLLRGEKVREVSFALRRQPWR